MTPLGPHCKKRNKMNGRDNYYFCDVCGSRGLASESSRLPQQTGRGSLIVCKHHVDATDRGLKSVLLREDNSGKMLRAIRPNTDGSVIVEYEDDPVETISAYVYLATSQGTNVLLLISQSETYLVE